MWLGNFIVVVIRSTDVTFCQYSCKMTDWLGRIMSNWIGALAGNVESLLDKVDQAAGQALHKEGENGSPSQWQPPPAVLTVSSTTYSPFLSARSGSSAGDKRDSVPHGGVRVSSSIPSKLDETVVCTFAFVILYSSDYMSSLRKHILYIVVVVCWCSMCSSYAAGLGKAIIPQVVDCFCSFLTREIWWGLSHQSDVYVHLLASCIPLYS